MKKENAKEKKEDVGRKKAEKGGEGEGSKDQWMKKDAKGKERKVTKEARRTGVFAFYFIPTEIPTRDPNAVQGYLL